MTYLEILATYGLATLLYSFFILGLFLAANHKFHEDGVQKGLILVGLKERMDSLLKKLDSIRLLVGLKNWLSLLAALTFVIVPTVKLLQTGDPFYALAYTGIVFGLGFQKSFYDLGVMFLGCYRCMSTFWAAIPLMASGIQMGFWINTKYLALMPLAILTTGIVSAIVSYIYMTYDRCKLEVDECTRDRELARMELEDKQRQLDEALEVSMPVNQSSADIMYKDQSGNGSDIKYFDHLEKRFQEVASELSRAGFDVNEIHTKF